MTEIEKLWECFKTTDTMLNMLLHKLDVNKYIVSDILEMLMIVAQDDTVSNDSRVRMMEVAQRAQRRLEQAIDTTKPN